MSKLPEPKKGTGVSYGNILGSIELGEVISTVHRTTINDGYALETVIKDLIPKKVNADIRVKIKDHATGKDVIADLVCLDGKPIAVEIKNGKEFDTKKSDAEWERVKTFAALYSQQVNTKVEPKVCLFPCNTRAEVVKGFKGVIKPGNAMTGKTLCKRLGVSHAKVIKIMQKGATAKANDQTINRDKWIDHLLEIDLIRQEIEAKLAERNLAANVQAVSEPSDGEPRGAAVSEVDTLWQEDNLSVVEEALATPDAESSDGK